MKKAEILKLAALNFGAGLVGMLLTYLVAAWLIGGERAQALLFIPWMVNGLMFTRTAYERGWLAGRHEGG